MKLGDETLRLAFWGVGIALTLALLWLVAKAVLPFAIGLVCGAAVKYFITR